MNDLNVSYRRSRRAKNMRITIHPTQAITVTVPVNLSLKHAEAFVRSKQAWIQKHLQKKRESQSNQPAQPQLSQEELNRAKDKLFSRLEYFSEKYKLPYNSQNNISLNINIAFLPEHLQDYILLHELCHIRHKNHSKDFWTQLDTYCDGRAKDYAKELKTYRMKIGA
ncbi:MAG: M48 family metallopeptidase [Planctomycetota bacterium]|jgi:predicted metal-dependent hydrolase